VIPAWVFLVLVEHLGAGAVEERNEKEEDETKKEDSSLRKSR
jgi:hypothetical protein